jgi:hypothetical protein
VFDENSAYLTDSESSYILILCYAMIGTTRLLDRCWAFTQVGGGQGTGNGEWLEAFAFPTSVHVELLHLDIIPDPVSIETVFQ